MHELTITKHLLLTILDYADTHTATKVTEVTVSIGELSGYVEESIRFYWDAVIDDERLKHTVVSFHRIPARISCTVCGTVIAYNQQLNSCPVCGSFKLAVISGNELEIDSITLEFS